MESEQELRTRIHQLLQIAMIQTKALHDIMDLSPNRVVAGKQFLSAQIFEIAHKAALEAKEIANAMD